MEAAQITPRRALEPDQKLARRESILLAARQLYQETGEELPSSAAIAERAGLAKGTVYLYFKSKEDIFLDLLSAEYTDLLHETSSTLEQFVGTREQMVAQFAAGYVSWIRRHPLLLQLGSTSHGALMRGATPECWLDMKRRLAQDMALTAQRLSERTGLTRTSAHALLIKGYGLTTGLYQLLHCPPSLDARWQLDEASNSRPDFFVLLEEGIRELWEGALPRRLAPGAY